MISYYEEKGLLDSPHVGIKPFESYNSDMIIELNNTDIEEIKDRIDFRADDIAKMVMKNQLHDEYLEKAKLLNTDEERMDLLEKEYSELIMNPRNVSDK